ncbi:hypothetical protein [Geopsychrobacter electrodiphilus]|uniref:hypothetical protein n=1 Tax=Geopsychrobacter electrodiphilus TaxID=225196 RepID=UPI000361EA03|nr:hypothetical protein [Geopsychrobacter electrodiphilus]
MKSRTIREFTYKDDLWSIVDSWARRSGFTMDLLEDSRRVYHKGNRLVMAPVCLEIRHDGSNVTLETWIKADMYLIMALMTGKPPEAGIQSGGLTAWIPRKRARKVVNPLLISLGQSPIT